MSESNSDEMVVITPKEGNNFYTVSIEIEFEDDNGKIKKKKEEHLVEGKTVAEVDHKVKDQMDGTISDWKVTKCQVSKINMGSKAFRSLLKGRRRRRAEPRVPGGLPPLSFSGNDRD